LPQSRPPPSWWGSRNGYQTPVDELEVRAWVNRFEEAGGYVRRLDGLPYHVTDRDGGLLVATDEESWRTLRATRSGISEDAEQSFGGGPDFNGIALQSVA